MLVLIVVLLQLVHMLVNSNQIKSVELVRLNLQRVIDDDYIKKILEMDECLEIKSMVSELKQVLMMLEENYESMNKHEWIGRVKISLEQGLKCLIAEFGAYGEEALQGGLHSHIHAALGCIDDLEKTP